MTTPGTAGYGSQAAELAVRYESISFEDVHRDVLHLLPATPASFADIGAGTGRDAAALARRGHRVVAVEPTPEMRTAGQQIHAAADIEWIDDSLPALANLRRLSRRFDVIMMTAVWMHLDAAERACAMEAIAALLAERGMVFMTLRHGPVPAGRRMFDVSTADTGALADQFGLRVIHDSQRGCMLGQPGVSWSHLVLGR